MPLTRLTDESGNAFLDESGNVLGDETYDGIATLVHNDLSVNNPNLSADFSGESYFIDDAPTSDPRPTVATVSGTDATITANRYLSGATGSVTITGNAATLTKVKVLVGETAVVNISGRNVDFEGIRAPEANLNLVVYVPQENRTVTAFKEVRPTLAIPQENRTVMVEYNPTKRNL